MEFQRVQMAENKKATLILRRVGVFLLDNWRNNDEKDNFDR